MDETVEASELQSWIWSDCPLHDNLQSSYLEWASGLVLLNTNWNQVSRTPHKIILYMTSLQLVSVCCHTVHVNSVNVEIKFHFECKHCFPCVQFMLWQMHWNNLLSVSIEAKHWASWLSLYFQRMQKEKLSKLALNLTHNRGDCMAEKHISAVSYSSVALLQSVFLEGYSISGQHTEYTVSTSMLYTCERLQWLTSRSRAELIILTFTEAKPCYQHFYLLYDVFEKCFRSTLRLVKKKDPFRSKHKRYTTPSTASYQMTRLYHGGCADGSFLHHGLCNNKNRGITF